MKKNCTIKVHINFKPWVFWYIKAVVLFCWVFKINPRKKMVYPCIKYGTTMKMAA